LSDNPPARPAPGTRSR